MKQPNLAQNLSLEQSRAKPKQNLSIPTGGT